jgi:hypothetical protein
MLCKVIYFQLAAGHYHVGCLTFIGLIAQGGSLSNKGRNTSFCAQRLKVVLQGTVKSRGQCIFAIYEYAH